MRRAPKKPLWPFTMNRDSKQRSGLVGWYPGGPVGASSFVDLSKTGAHGTLTNFASPRTLTSGWVAGQDGGRGALRMDGTDDYVDVGKNFGGVSQLTMSVWLTKFAVGDLAHIISRMGNNSVIDSTDAILFHLQTDNIYRCVISVGSTGFTVTSASAATIGLNALITIVYDGLVSNTLSLYYNGILSGSTGSTTGTIHAAATTNCRFGYSVDPTFASPLNGIIEDVRIYYRALSKNEVWDLWNPKTRWELRWQPSRTAYSFRIASQPPIGRSYATSHAAQNASRF